MFYYPYGQGDTDLERFNPKPRSELGDIIQQLAGTWLKSKGIKQQRMQAQKDRSLLEQLINSLMGGQ